MTDEERLRAKQRAAILALLLLCARLKDGSISPGEFPDAAAAVLATGHAWAWCIGSGHPEPTADDYARGQEYALAEVGWLTRLAADILGGRYGAPDGGGEGAPALRARLMLYILRMTGTANAAMAAREQEEARRTGRKVQEAKWELSIAEHCGDCLDENALGWRLLSEFTRWPGDGSTQCISQCKCFVVFRDGRRGFSNR